MTPLVLTNDRCHFKCSSCGFDFSYEGNAFLKWAADNRVPAANVPALIAQQEIEDRKRASRIQGAKYRERQSRLAFERERNMSKAASDARSEKIKLAVQAAKERNIDEKLSLERSLRINGSLPPYPNTDEKLAVVLSGYTELPIRRVKPGESFGQPRVMFDADHKGPPDCLDFMEGTRGAQWKKRNRYNDMPLDEDDSDKEYD